MIAILAYPWGCQDYPFEFRNAERSQARKITEIVKNPVPVDILFVIDNSGSMNDEMELLRTNLEGFIGELTNSDNDFQLGIITTDMECNVPERDCAADITTSEACCTRVEQDGIARCEIEKDSENNVTWTNCDGGMLRSTKSSGGAFFTRPTDEASRQKLLADMRDTIASLGCQGSGLEAGLEAMQRAVSCAEGTLCPYPDIKSRNAGFIRENADLAVIFLTDEDDCSFLNDTSVFNRPLKPLDATHQAAHLCKPIECYAYYGMGNDMDGDGMMDWADNDAGTPAARRFTCSGFDRGFYSVPEPQPRLVPANPPLPTEVNVFIEALIGRKDGDIRRVRAAGIVSSVPDETQPLGYRASHCYVDPVGSPSEFCGCWTASPASSVENNFYCALTGAVKAEPVDRPFLVCGGTETIERDGCGAMPSGRYVKFLETLASRRVAEAQARPDTLVDSICRADYADTLFKIVNTVILTSCFELFEEPPARADDIEVRLNGKVVENVEAGSDSKGWSWIQGTRTVCLEGGLTKEYGDTFEIVVLED